jgi:hypothetical protein
MNESGNRQEKLQSRITRLRRGYGVTGHADIADELRNQETRKSGGKISTADLKLARFPTPSPLPVAV